MVITGPDYQLFRLFPAGRKNPFLYIRESRKIYFDNKKIPPRGGRRADHEYKGGLFTGGDGDGPRDPGTPRQRAAVETPSWREDGGLIGGQRGECGRWGLTRPGLAFGMPPTAPRAGKAGPVIPQRTPGGRSDPNMARPGKMPGRAIAMTDRKQPGNHPGIIVQDQDSGGRPLHRRNCADKVTMSHSIMPASMEG